MTDYINLRKIVTGDIILKCRFGNDIRRIPINGVPTYDELCLMMYRVFKQDISSSEDITLKYQDEEGDMISLLDDIDITHAISISSLLKITIYDKSNQQQQAPVEISTLIDIRDKLDQLIQSSTTNKEQQVVKEEQVKKINRLTPAELASFSATDTETKGKSSPKAPSSVTVPYYPPNNSTSSSVYGTISTMTTPNVPATNQLQLTTQQQQQVQQQPQVQQQQFRQQFNHSYIQPPSQPQQQTPQSFGHTNQQFNNNISHYPLPSNDPRSQLQQQQQQPQTRQGYYAPPLSASMNTPQLPPQPFRPLNLGN